MVQFHVSNNGRHKYIALVSPSEWNAAHPDDPIDSIKTVRFGGIKKDGTPYEQYKDKLGHYSAYDHGDKKRRDNYKRRHMRITMDDNGTEVPAYQYKYSPA